MNYLPLLATLQFTKFLYLIETTAHSFGAWNYLRLFSSCLFFFFLTACIYIPMTPGGWWTQNSLFRKCPVLELPREHEQKAQEQGCMWTSREVSLPAPSVLLFFFPCGIEGLDIPSYGELVKFNLSERRERVSVLGEFKFFFVRGRDGKREEPGEE